MGLAVALAMSARSGPVQCASLRWPEHRPSSNTLPPPFANFTHEGSESSYAVTHRDTNPFLPSRSSPGVYTSCWIADLSCFGQGLAYESTLHCNRGCMLSVGDRCILC